MHNGFSTAIKSGVLTVTLLVLVAGAGARALYDFDGDGKTDFIVKRQHGTGTSYTWFTLRSKDGFDANIWGYQFGIGAGMADNDTLGDFDGDGKWDIAVTRKGASFPPCLWYILNSSDGSMSVYQWGLRGDLLVPQDYDGDGKTDVAVYRLGGWWYIFRSSDGQFQAENFGTGNDSPFMGGDYDGDGKDDLAVVRITAGPMVQLFIRLSGSGNWAQYSLGDARFTGVVAGDYDGDGKADPAIWQGNQWWWIRSSDKQLGGGIRFGAATSDQPVPADYDGDGTTDVAVFRSSEPDPGLHRYFFVQQSRDGFVAIPWGGGLGNDDANVFDLRYFPKVGFRPAPEPPVKGEKLERADDFADKGPFPRFVATGKGKEPR